MTCERRAIALDTEFKTREDGDRKYIEGYFARFGSKYWLWDDAYETIDEGAFNLTRDTDVRALTNHDTTLVLGRTTAKTLALQVDSIGLFGTIEINENDTDAMNSYERVKRGDVTQCSFGFDILAQEVEYQDGMPTVWHLRDVKLYEVSVVTFPAYEDTAVTARQAERDQIRLRRLEAWRAEMRNKLKKE